MPRQLIIATITAAILAAVTAVPAAEGPPRARDLGIPFEGTPGAVNAITDVAGVTVGHTAIIRDLDDGKAVRTGVTAVLPRGRESAGRPVFAGWFTLNGNGEMTGTTWVEESGFLEGPVMITNTHSVGAVHEGVISWRIRQGAADSSGYWWSLPVVAETWDGFLNDINGLHVRPEHAHAALDAASGGRVAEGNVGGGTGMICHAYKCGIGTASRVTDTAEGRYTVGVLVQANYGDHDTLRIGGLPVGQMLPDPGTWAGYLQPPEAHSSIIIVVATDAPLLPHQLKRVAKRASLGLARVGGIGNNSSGDIFIAFSTANGGADQSAGGQQLRMLANDHVSPVFRATVEATEEAIVNALIAGRDMTGNLGHTVRAIDHDALLEVLRRHDRLSGAAQP